MNIFTASFLASFVEFVEALTIILAVGLTRGWKTSIAGGIAGIAVLAILVAIFGPSIQLIPIHWMQLGVGFIVLIFGGRWLIKAVKRSAGIIPLHDEAKIYDREVKFLSQQKSAARFDVVGFLTSFKAVLVEGLEVVFVVVTTGGLGRNLSAAVVGASMACVIVLMLGLIAHKPLTKIPENTFKYAVGVMLTAFGIFWIGEGFGISWPGDDLFILAFVIVILLVSLCISRVIRKGNSGNYFRSSSRASNDKPQ